MLFSHRAHKAAGGESCRGLINTGNPFLGQIFPYSNQPKKAALNVSKQDSTGPLVRRPKTSENFHGLPCFDQAV